ncbi:MAG: excinuclease ABC subunit UvrC [Bacilli bacterium]|jgi:excinuclease ABC subunit C
MMRTSELLTAAKALSHSPGVYLMKDRFGKIIYVGKAKDLNHRVTQYFARPQVGKVAAMVKRIAAFETIETNNEKEALILEMNLIKTHYPRYNVLLKDDSHYPYIALSKSADPYLKIARNRQDKRFDYFGPYPNSKSAYQTLQLLNKLFPFRKCHTIPSTPCLYYHLGQCLGPCVAPVKPEIYDEISKKTMRFLNGYNQEVQRELKGKIKSASKRLEFEQAADYQKLLQAVIAVQTKQNVELKQKKAIDVFAFSKRDSYFSLGVLVYRKGELLGKRTFVVEGMPSEDELISQLIFQYYENHELPSEIIVSRKLIKAQLELLYDIPITVPTRGQKLDLITLAKKNASLGLDEYFLTARLEEDQALLLEQLGEKLEIPTPYFIVLFDNAHLQSSSPVGAMVAYLNGQPVKKHYRKFHLSDDFCGDDLQAMEEIIYRRLQRMQENRENFPDLILVDGGENQVRAGEKALQKLGLSLPIAGLYKNKKHQTEGLINHQGEVINLEDTPKLFFLLMRMQDEVHRYALSFHQKTRKKKMFSSVLDEIPGIGIKRKARLQASFPHLQALKQASLEDLSQILPTKVAQALYQRLQTEE